MPRKRFPTIASGKKKRERDKKLATKEVHMEFLARKDRLFSSRRRFGAKSLKGLFS